MRRDRLYNALMEVMGIVGEAVHRHQDPCRVGFWSAIDPPQQHVDLSWSAAERDAVLAHLRAGKVAASYMGYHSCRICGEAAGHRDLTDGTWTWPEGLAHYVDSHGVRPGRRFVSHACRARRFGEDSG